MPKQSPLPDDYSADWLASLDGRTRLSKAVNERFNSLSSDLGGDLSYQQRSLAKRAIWMEAVIEQQEARLSRGEEVDQAKLTQSINSLLGLLKTLGLERKAKPVQSITEYIAAQRAAQ